MNPELPQPQPRIETPPQGVDSVERIPGAVERGLETQPTSANIEQIAQQAPVLPVVAPTVAPPATTPRPQADDDSLVSGTPTVASDDDIIEKEWVDKLKKIITLTRDNPYERARVIAQLQADYLKKRYNKTLGQAEE